MKTPTPVKIKMIGLLLMCLLIPKITQADDTSMRFFNGVKNYQNGNFQDSVKNFSEIVHTGIANGKLFYNLGNAYLKLNDIGHAILWYKRAFKLIPNDPDLKFNYTVALSRVKDLPADNNHSIFKVIFFWKYLLSRSQVQWLGVLLNSIFWIVLTFELIFRKNRLKWARNIILVPTVVLFLTALYNYYDAIYNKQAVIIRPEISVRSGMSDGSTELFVLHAGSQVHVDKEKDGFLKIRFSKDKIGWIQQTDAKVI